MQVEEPKKNNYFSGLAIPDQDEINLDLAEE